MKPSPSILLVALAPWFFPACSSTATSGEFRSEHGYFWGHGTLMSNRQWGEWNYFDDQKVKRASGSYRSDRQDGHWTYWYANGQVEWDGWYRDVKLDGPSEHHYQDGNLRARGVFAGGSESGLWRFHGPRGDLSASGCFSGGKPALRWTYFDAQGSKSAEGYKLDGQKVGLWRYFESGGEAIALHPLPDGLELARDEGADRTPEREGFVRAGRHEGPWIAWHAADKPKLAGRFENGLATGPWIAWNEHGEVLAQGEAARGRPNGEWRVFLEPGRGVLVDAAQIDQRVDDPAEAQALDELARVASWLAALAAAPPAPLREAVPASASAPSEALARETSRRPTIPIRPQPWTKREEENIAYLLQRYEKGARATKPPAGSGYGPVSLAPTGDRDRARALLGKPLPAGTVVFTGEGEELPIERLRGKKILMVIMRGFDGYVCVYCTTQLEVLRGHEQDFIDAGAEVVILYPGEKDYLDAFLAAHKELSDGKPAPAFRLSYDPDLALIKELDLSDALARPTTLILDVQGVVRWAYVGQSPEDRPGAQDILKALRELEGGR